ncbi:MAG: AAA family ATPase, partial [bacterium]
MSKQFKPTQSSDVFVGRRKQIDNVLQLFEKNKKKWLVHITGDGGIGKTRFLQVLRNTIAEHEPVGAWQCTEMIDFYKPSNQTAFGLLNEIARQVSLEFFGRFVEQRKVYDNVLRSEPDQAQQLEAFERVANAFFEDLQDLLKTGRRIVLFFDTCEESQPVSHWLSWKLLVRLSNILEQVAALARENKDVAVVQQPALLAIFAGRTPIPFQKDLKKAILNIHLAPLTKNEMADFFEKVEWYPHKINKKQLKELFVRCAGRPLYMAMSYDWLANEMGTVDELLSTADSFSKKLVDWILRFRDQQSNVILASALAWRRMEAGLLAKLLRISEPEAIQLFEDLSKYSFVKYRRPATDDNFAGSFQLHDVMRNFVNEHTWPGEGRWTHKAMLQDVLSWYEKRIGDESVITGKERPKFDEQRSLVTEYLYYKLLQDVNAGAEYGEMLFKRASYFIDLSLCDLYNAEINRFVAELPD